MSENDALHRLAAAVGIEDGWWDFFGQWRPVSVETKTAFLAAMGFAAQSPAAAEDAFRNFDESRWRRMTPPVAVMREGEGFPAVDLYLSKDWDDVHLPWALLEESGARHLGEIKVRDLPILEERQLDGKTFRKRHFDLPISPPTGYHRLSFTLGDKESALVLIMAPRAAHWPDAVRRGGRVWGVATQLYALRRPDDWGVGDFTSLRAAMEMASGLGAGAVGVNPLHAMFPPWPNRFSPYSPSSRLFLNTAYIDIEAAPEFANCAKAQARMKEPDFQESRHRAAQAELVDYPAVAALKTPMLEWLFETFSEEASPARRQEFAQFCQDGGPVLQRFALFQALHEHFWTQDANLGYWRNWPEAYQNPASPESLAFAKNHRARLDFHMYLQWLADTQLAKSAEAARATGMAVGLYRDLAVGFPDDGAEAWSNPAVLAPGVSVGAPPDMLNLLGQDWGLAPFNPVALFDQAYAPFVAVLRANMRHAGALRLDHVMQLMRLYWVPAGAKADQGAYVRYPFDDLLAIVALESRRNRCLVIGEDLGTVPDGFREKLRDAGIFAYRLFVFEREPDGAFRASHAWFEPALASVGTHDMPPLAGFWKESDLEQRERLNLYPKPETAQQERAGRAQDRKRLLEHLVREQFLTPGLLPDVSDLSPEDMARLIRAVYLCLDRTPTRLMMVQLEDVLAQEAQMNLPGTVEEYPNWRVRHDRTIGEIAALPLLVSLARVFSVSRLSIHA